MGTIVQNIANRCLLAMLRHSVVGQWEGIRIASTGQQDPDLVPVVTTALELIRRHDQRRLKRLQAHVEWIFDQPHSGGSSWGSYLPSIKACRIDFEINPAFGDHLVHAASYAGLFVHEATHGAICARGFDYNQENRAQIERVCYSEQNRFLLKLNRERPGLGDALILQYDSLSYDISWTQSRLQRLISDIRRILVKEVPSRRCSAREPAIELKK